MQTQSPALRQALVAGRQWITNTVEVIEGGAGPADAALATLEPDGGSMGLDETRASRRVLTGLHLGINDANADLIPGAVGELLHPATGNELRVRSGRKYGRTNMLSPDNADLADGLLHGWGLPSGFNKPSSGQQAAGMASVGAMAPAKPGTHPLVLSAATWDQCTEDIALDAGQDYIVAVWVMGLSAGANFEFGFDTFDATGANNGFMGSAGHLPAPQGVWTPYAQLVNTARANPAQSGVLGSTVSGQVYLQNDSAGVIAYNAMGVFRGGPVDANRTLAPEVETNAAGVFRFDKLPVVDSTGALSMTVAGLDRAFGISQHRWTDAFHLRRNTLILDGIRRVAADRWTGKHPLIVDTSACVGHPITEMTVPNSILGTDQTNADPYADLTALATAGGCELMLDEVGRLVVRPFIDPSKEIAAASYTEGIDCTMVDLTREIDPTRTFSGIVVTGGSGTDRACRAVVWDTDPTSPTYVGKVGYIPAFFDSPLLRHDAQCQLVGEGLLKRLRLSSEIVTFTATPNPGLEAADAVFIARERAKATGIYGVSSYGLPLDPTSAMSLTTRSTSDIPGDKIS